MAWVRVARQRSIYYKIGKGVRFVILALSARFMYVFKITCTITLFFGGLAILIVGLALGSNFIAIVGGATSVWGYQLGKYWDC